MSDVPPEQPYGSPPPPPPPPVGGSYPPPPPPPPGGYQQSGGYPPPPPPGPFPQPGGYPPPGPAGGVGSQWGPLAEWPQRALGWLIDWGIGIGAFVVLLIIGAILGSVSTGLFVLFYVLGFVSLFGWVIYCAIQVGQTGQSPGMRVIGLKAVKKDTGQLLGTGMGVVRWLVHLVLGFVCLIPQILDYLFPLWDAERQTLADKAVNSVVITVPKAPFSIGPPAGTPTF